MSAQKKEIENLKAEKILVWASLISKAIILTIGKIIPSEIKIHIQTFIKAALLHSE